MAASTYFQESRHRSATSRVMIESRQEYLSKAVDGADISGGSSSNQALGTGFRHQSQSRQSYQFFKNWVYVAVNSLAKKLASQPLCVGEITDASPNPARSLPPQTKSAVATFLKNSAEAETLEIIESHPALDVFANPNPVQGKFEFFYSSVVNLQITGEAYWVAGVKKNEEGEEKLELWSVPTNWVVPNHDRGLFSSFDIVINGKTVAKGLGPEAVARTYYPHPTNMQQAWSPLLACMNAAQIDNHILGSQKQMFKKGIFPNMVVTIGKQRGPDGKATDMRPVLKGHQRRQIVSAVREIWNQTANAGEPAIIDGLIDSIHKLQSTPAEMDWTRSGDSIKERVMQCFQVNPIFVGQVIGANRAQAAEAKQSVLENAVNPMIDAFSETATSFVGPMFETPERLVVWLEKAFAVDQEIQLKKWDTARKNHDVTTNEFRTNILNLPPLEDEELRNDLLSTHTGMATAMQMMVSVSGGALPREIAARMFALFFELDEEAANNLAGMDLPEVEAEPVAIPEPQPSGNSDNDAELEEETEDLDAVAASIQELEAKLEGQHEHVIRVGNTMIKAVEDLLEAHRKRIDEALDAQAG